MRGRQVDSAADLAEVARLVATLVNFRVMDGDQRTRPEIARDVLLDVPSFPKLGRAAHILRRRIAARLAPGTIPAACST